MTLPVPFSPSLFHLPSHGRAGDPRAGRGPVGWFKNPSAVPAAVRPVILPREVLCGGRPGWIDGAARVEVKLPRGRDDLGRGEPFVGLATKGGVVPADSF